MRPSLSAALVVVAFIAPTHLSAASSAPLQLDGVTLPQLGARSPVDDPTGEAPVGQKPFKGLFRSPLQPSPTVTAPSRSPSAARTRRGPRERETTVVCGTAVVPLDPAFDEAIRQTAPESGPRAVVRTVPPLACRQ